VNDDLDRLEKALMAQRTYYRSIWLDRLNKTTKTSGSHYSSRNRNGRLPNTGHKSQNLPLGPSDVD